MAIIKEIELPSGITINYHRVVSVNNITNQASIIEMAGYTSKAKREEEKQKTKTGEEMNVFIDTTYVSAPYNQNFNVVSAYQYIKRLPAYSGCADDLD